MVQITHTLVTSVCFSVNGSIHASQSFATFHGGLAPADEVSCDDSGILRKTRVDALCDRVWSPSPLASFVVEGCCCWWHKTVLNSWQAPHQQRRRLLRAATELLHMACSEQFFELLAKTTSKTGFIL